MRHRNLMNVNRRRCQICPFICKNVASTFPILEDKHSRSFITMPSIMLFISTHTVSHFQKDSSTAGERVRVSPGFRRIYIFGNVALQMTETFFQFLFDIFSSRNQDNGHVTKTTVVQIKDVVSIKRMW